MQHIRHFCNTAHFLHFPKKDNCHGLIARISVRKNRFFIDKILRMRIICIRTISTLISDKRMYGNDRSLMELMITMTQVSRAYKGVCDKLASRFGLTQAIAWPIVAISRLGDGVRPGVIADTVGIEPSSVVRLIDQLVASGLIERREDANDRRARLLFLTAEGRRKVAEIEAALVPLRRQLLQGLSEQELDVCMHVFKTLGESIERHRATARQHDQVA